jgi:hypothetical protein
MLQESQLFETEIIASAFSAQMMMDIGSQHHLVSLFTHRFR